MANLKFLDPAGYDIVYFAPPDRLSGTVTTHSATTWRVTYAPGIYTEFTGTAFAYDGDNYVTGGTITGIKNVIDNKVQWQATGLSLPGADLAHLHNATTLFTEALSGNDSVTGGTGDDHLMGFAGNDVLDGGKGADIMEGGDGNDTYIVDDLNDEVNDGGGPNDIDTVKTALSNLGNLIVHGIDNFVFTGKGDWTFTANEDNNTVTGGTGNDVLDGGGGKDTLIGGAGNDTYMVNSADDTVIDSAGTSDTIVSSILPVGIVTGIENYTYTGNAAWSFNGNDLNNILTGGSGADVLDGGKGNDTLDGGSGADKMTGGLGNDTFIVDNAGDTVVEATKGGIDLIKASVTIDLTNDAHFAGEIENVTLTGGGNINAVGNGLNNVLTGNTGDNTLDGAAGGDTLAGGDGNDKYEIDNAGDKVVELTGATSGSHDLIETTILLKTAIANVEDYTYTGAKADWTFAGNALDNIITAGAGNDTLTGGGGKDTLKGGAGNDTYVIDSLDDTVKENAGEGSADTVKTSAAITTAFAEVENYIFTGSGDWKFTGNSLDNTITGGAGNDVLDGGGGKDTLIGGAGNDTYKVDSADDTVIDSAGTSDTIVSSILPTGIVAGIENYTYTGSSAWSFTGNDLNNILTGGSGSDVLDGGKGNDTLDGGTGADKMTGGLGNDTYVVDDLGDRIVEAAKGGTDTVQTSLAVTNLATDASYAGQEIENLTLLAGAKDATGNALDNVITGNGADNKLDGAGGADTLAGGDGNDTYEIDNAGDKVVELAGATSGSHDLIETTILLKTAVANVEDYTYKGVTADWSFTGNASDNIIIAGAGNDTLDGGAGKDTLKGGDGNDTYILDNSGDTVVEAAKGGTDLIKASVTVNLGSGAFVGQEIENVTLTGTGNISAGGNALDNILTGNGGSNVLDGGAGNDTMIGGAGNDVYWVDSAGDTVIDSGGTLDQLATYTILFSKLTAGIEGYHYFGNADWTFTGDDASNVLEGGNGNDTLDGGKGNDTLLGGKGNDTLTGGAGNDELLGGAGNDIMIGGAGDDIYKVDSATDQVIEGAKGGIDLVESSLATTDLSKLYAGQEIEELLLLTGGVDAVGNEFNNIIEGNAVANKISGGDGNDELIGLAGDDTLDGGKGNDTLYGGDGNDIYVIDSTGDKALEGATGNAGSHDLIETSILLKTAVANIEDYTYTGTGDWTFTGSTVANIITGGSGNDTLAGGAGNDTLNGGDGNDTLKGDAGDDTMTGGKGNDTYEVDSLKDVVKENANEGIDTIRTSIAITQVAEVENYIFTGKGNWSFAGNALDNHITGGAGNDTLDGGDGNDVLDGGTGADSMTGGKGNDTFLVDNIGDKVHESSAQGTDTVKTTLVNFSAASGFDNVENFVFTGKGGWTFTGNAGDNIVQSAAGNDHLDGGAGNDTAVMLGSFAEYTMTVTASGVVLTDHRPDANGVDGTDILTNFEHIKFLDGTIDVPTMSMITGAAKGDNLGTSLAGIGDFNGDGIGDFVIGAPGTDGKAVDSGAAYVVFGTGSGLPANFDLGILDGSNGFKLTDATKNAEAGYSVQSAGDVNGDGYNDIIVGAAAYGSGALGAGAAYVVFGGASGFAPQIDLDSLSGSKGFKLTGQTGDGTGIAVVHADLNGDGFSDLVIGAPASSPAGPISGITYVVFGHGGSFANVDLTGLNGTDGIIVQGNQPSAFGLAVASAGDINGDGIEDLIIGAPFSGQYDAHGATIILFGHTGSFSATGSFMNFTPLDLFGGTFPEGQHGASVAGIGDYNGDGFGDVLVGAPYSDWGGRDSGGAYILFGTASGIIPFDDAGLQSSGGYILAGGKAGDHAGVSVASAGDFNGDGYDDVLVGADGAGPGDQGATYVLFGRAMPVSSAGFGSLEDTNAPGAGFKIDGLGGGGHSVSAAGDLNDDGFDDLLVGNPGAKAGGAGSGSVMVIYGGNSGDTATLFEGTSGNDTKNGTSAAEIFTGGAGNDTLNGGGGADVLHGGTGNDTIVVTDHDFFRVKGDGGTDTLKLNYSGAIDFANLDGNGATSDRGKISSIEVIDVNNGSNNAMTLHLADVLDIAPQDQNVGGVASLDNVLKIVGNTGDTLALSSADGWSAADTATLTGYAVYTHHGAIIAVDTHINVTVG